MKSKSLLAIATLMVALSCSVAAHAQTSIIHYGTVQGTIQLPLRTTPVSNRAITCSNLRVWYRDQADSQPRYVAPQVYGVGTCSYQITGVSVGKPHTIGLAWAGPGDYEVRFLNNLTSLRVILNEPNQVRTYNFTSLVLREIPQ